MASEHNEEATMYRQHDATTINLGDRVRDRVSGITGIATGRANHLNKCVQFCIEPSDVREGKPVEGFFADEEQLDVIERGVVAVRDNTDAVDIPLGARVRDKVSGLQGIVVIRCDWAGAGRRYSVRPVGANKDGKLYDAASICDVHLEVLDAGAVQTRKVAQTGGAFDARPTSR